jgi:hypothetical protein
MLKFFIFLCPHKFDNLCWGLIQVSTTIRATTICFTVQPIYAIVGSKHVLGICYFQTFIGSIWKLFWSQTSGMMPWECGQVQVPSAPMVPLSLSTQVCHFQFLFTSLFNFFCDCFVDIALLKNRGF